MRAPVVGPRPRGGRTRLVFEPLVLCYHATSDSWAHALSVGPRALERQIRSIVRRGYRPATAAEALQGGGRCVHVTFDDAFRSVADGLAVLERLGVPATIFACAANADTGRVLAVPELAAEVREHPEELATMTWDDLRNAAERGVEIGSHTVTHPHLVDLDGAELARELRVSRLRVEEELGRPCRFLAYPYGEADARVRAAARAAGYDAAFGLPGSRSPLLRFAVPRVGVYRRDTVLRLAVKTSPFADTAKAVVARYRRA